MLLNSCEPSNSPPPLNTDPFAVRGLKVRVVDMRSCPLSVRSPYKLIPQVVEQMLEEFSIVHVLRELIFTYSTVKIVVSV